VIFGSDDGGFGWMKVVFDLDFWFCVMNDR
jgi:hypothetical protein